MDNEPQADTVPDILTESYRAGLHRRRAYQVREDPPHLDAGLEQIKAESMGEEKA